MATATKKETREIGLVRFEKATITVRIVGDSPLIMHAWSEKAKKEILDKQTKKAKSTTKEAKNPVEDFIRSMYWLTPMPEEMTEDSFLKACKDGARFGFPATAFKQAISSGAYRLGVLDGKKSELDAAFYIEGGQDQMVEIHLPEGEHPVMREDMVKVGGMTKVADIRYRGEFRNWWAELKITYIKGGKFSEEQIVNYINAGGMCCGVGEWRMERKGQFGLFHVISNK